LLFQPTGTIRCKGICAKLRIPFRHVNLLSSRSQRLHERLIYDWVRAAADADGVGVLDRLQNFC